MGLKLFSFVLTGLLNFLLIYNGKILDKPIIILGLILEIIMAIVLMGVRKNFNLNSQKIIEGMFYGVISMPIVITILVFVLSSYKW